MGIEIRKVTERVISADGSEAAETTRTRVLVGEAKEELRWAHAMFLVAPSGAILASQALGGGVMGGVIASLAGFFAADGWMSLTDQTRARMESEREARREAGEAEPSGARRAGRALRAFSSLAADQARLALIMGRLVVGGAPALLAQWATQRLPRVNAALSKANPAFNKLARESMRLRLEANVRRGSQRCARLFFARLEAFEDGGFDLLGDASAMGALWRQGGLSGASKDPLNPEKGSIRERLAASLPASQAKKGSKAAADQQELLELLRLCEVSEEASALEGVVGEARRAQDSTGRSARPRL